MLVKHIIVETKVSRVFMNQELLRHFDRSIESRKGQNRNVAHKSLVAQFIRELEQTLEPAVSHPPQGVTSTDIVVHSTINMNSRLATYLKNLPKCHPNKFKMGEKLKIFIS